MYKVAVNGKTFEVEQEAEQWKVNGDVVNWDISALGNGHFHILNKSKGYQAEIVKIDRAAKVVDMKINGQKFSVQLKDKFDLLLEKMGINASVTNKVNVIKAPMPGLIVDLRVKDGASVKAGDALLVLEAMKMENIIKAPGDGLIKKVNVKKGDRVEKGQMLIEL
ncbi:MAG TPA: biotin/lipoyl-binding protein [Cyclobacteriaceae bacterium]|nr:biotin/lipoyl-binding protein [Cyclobacteriaceae bacterium]